MTNNINGEDMDDNDFNEFPQEAYLLSKDNDLLINNSEMVILVKCICLFMAHWQKLFNITNNWLFWLLKFLHVFLKVIFENVEKQELSNFDCGKQFFKGFPTTVYPFRKTLGSQ